MSFFISRFFRAISGIVTIFLLKYFGSDDVLGTFTYWSIIILFGAVFVQYNHQVFVLRYKDSIAEKFSSLFYNQLLFWIILNLIFVFALPLNYFLISFIFLTVLLFDPWESYYTIVKDYKLTNKVIILLSITSIILKIFTILLIEKSKLAPCFLALTILDYSSGLILFAIYEKSFSFYTKININETIKTFNFLFPFLLNVLLIFLAAKVDHLLIKSKLDFAELGIYSFAYKFYEGAFILQVIFNSIIVSKYTDSFTSKGIKLEFIDFLKKWFVIIGISILIACLMMFYSLTIDDYLPIKNLHREITILLILTPGLLFSFFGVIMSALASVNGFSKELLIINTTVFFISLILNYFLIDIYGLYVSAIITLMNQILSSFLFWFCFRRTRVYLFNLLRNLLCLN
tara:strand:- start:3235 stop:4437 length:1203 start_codon:yes stop_codon:yes gene_type:complete